MVQTILVFSWSYITPNHGHISATQYGGDITVIVLKGRRGVLTELPEA